MIYGFITDTALYHYDSDEIDTYVNINAGAGFLTEKMANYFLTPQTLRDTRSSRLSILPNVAYGKTYLHMDRDKIDPSDPFETISATEQDKFFNIIEQAYLAQSTDAATLDALFQGDTTNFGGYVAGTLVLASSVVTLNVTNVSGSTDDNVAIRNWIQFSFVLGDADPHTVEFKIFLGEISFLNDYPFSNIATIIYPCDAANLLDMGYSNQLDAIAQSANYMDDKIDAAMQANNYSGAKKYSTLYVNTNYATQYTLPFAVVYKGQPPSVMEMRKAIRDALLAEVDNNEVPLADEDTWRTIFPDLFVQNMFYLIPIWNNTQDIPGKTIFRSIIDYNNFYDVLAVIFPDMDEAYIKANMEVLNNSAAELFIVGLPFSENEDVTSILSQHPTYISVDATTPAWNDQAEVTQNFNRQLSEAIGVALGAPNTYALAENMLDDKWYLTFVTNFIDYHVLKAESFPEI